MPVLCGVYAIVLFAIEYSAKAQHGRARVVVVGGRNLEIWEIWNLENPEQCSLLKSKIRVAQNVGKLQISEEQTVPCPISEHIRSILPWTEQNMKNTF